MKFGALLIIGVACAFTLQAQQPVEVDDRIEERNFMPYELMYYKDVSNAVTFEQISSATFATKFQQHTDYRNKDFVPNASYWVRLPIRHAANTQKAWLLEFYDQTIDHIDAYVPQVDGTYQLIKLGDEQPFTDRLFRHKNFELMLNMKSDTVMFYYFKVQSHDFADIRIAFRSTNRFIYYSLNEYFLFGTFYGMILIIALYNFLTFLAIREIKYIYYIFYIISVALYAMSLDGIGFQYLWPHQPQWNAYATGISLYLVILWSLIFTRRFLSLAANGPTLNTIFKWAIALRTAIFLFALFFAPAIFSQRIIEIAPLSLIFYSAIHVWRNGYRPARFFVIAYGVLFAGFFLRAMVYFNFLPFTILSHYSLHLSFVLEMLFLTLALGDRIRILKDNRDRALRKIIRQHEANMQLKDTVNRELEQRVKERTLELDAKNLALEESNHKLVKQSTEINQINSLLDLDNWKLKNRVKEVLNEMLMEKTMNYDEFKTLYPDTLAAYRFLETLKWEQGFHCGKCGNPKYFEGAQKFARRCTKCGYNESITAFTIFQGIKFPLEKAFYIAYLCVVGKKEGTLESFARQLDVGLNTVWAFRTKVMTRLKELEDSGRRLSASKWEEVMLYPESSPKVRPKKAKSLA
ncbi:MAG: transposase [Bacteroidetes bacterium]|nr:transposase [Bacteroidota bacterium]